MQTGLSERLAVIRDDLHAGTSRREFVRTLVSAGYAGWMAHLLGVDDFLEADDGTVPVVTALVRPDPGNPQVVERRTKSVPTAWYAAVTKAFELNELLARSRYAGYFGSAVVPGSYEDGTAGLTIEVSTDTDDVDRWIGTLRDLARDGFDAANVTLDLEAVDDISLDGSSSSQAESYMIADVESGLIPGGVNCESDRSYATLGPALYHPELDRRFFVTAHHVFEPTNVIGARLNLRARDETYHRLGRVRSSYPREDVAVVAPSMNSQPTSVIETPEPVRVRGQYTRFGLADLVAQGEPLEKMGSITGHTTGAIQGIDAVTSLLDDFTRRGQLRWGNENDFTDGDSGSVSFRADPEAPEEGVLIAGFNNARTWWPGQSYIWGTAAYEFTERYGYHF